MLVAGLLLLVHDKRQFEPVVVDQCEAVIPDDKYEKVVADTQKHRWMNVLPFALMILSFLACCYAFYSDGAHVEIGFPILLLISVAMMLVPWTVVNAERNTNSLSVVRIDKSYNTYEEDVQPLLDRLDEHPFRSALIIAVTGCSAAVAVVAAFV